MVVLVLTVMLGGLQQPRPDVVAISGAKDPQLVPEYLMWRNAFAVLAQASRHDRKLVLDALKLPDGDKTIILIEAAPRVNASAHVTSVSSGEWRR
jgi:hypothetical protein